MNVEKVVDRLKALGWEVNVPHPWFTECKKDGVVLVLSASALSARSEHSAWTSLQTWERIKESAFVPLPGNAMGGSLSTAEKEASDVVLEELNR